VTMALCHLMHVGEFSIAYIPDAHVIAVCSLARTTDERIAEKGDSIPSRLLAQNLNDILLIFSLSRDQG
jgi:hypothetical protein